MRYLFADWQRLKERIKRNRPFIFLDYDGTLTPIVETPQKAILPEETKEILIRLSRRPKCKLAIISGRALKDIKKLIGIKNIIYAGNHGFELEGPKIKFKNSFAQKYQKLFRRIKEDLENKLSKIKDVFIEDKGYSLSLHYRLVKEEDIPLVKTIFHETIIIPCVKGQLKIFMGKKVFEIRLPSDWDKGKAVLWLLARQQFGLKDNKVFPIYIGDDITDEDAFKALRNKGLTVFVGNPKKSQANYYVKNTWEVKEFLEKILELYNTKYAKANKG
ncbi:MAG: trehalose-phosphatase [Candidatus Omnitrophota bacterium]|nr:trehalose-phosphatase [Candidatus Omnitrophota bacterium]